MEKGKEHRRRPRAAWWCCSLLGDLAAAAASCSVWARSWRWPGCAEVRVRRYRQSAVGLRGGGCAVPGMPSRRRGRSRAGWNLAQGARGHGPWPRRGAAAVVCGVPGRRRVRACHGPAHPMPGGGEALDVMRLGERWGAGAPTGLSWLRSTSAELQVCRGGDSSGESPHWEVGGHDGGATWCRSPAGGVNVGASTLLHGFLWVKTLSSSGRVTAAPSASYPS